MVLTVIIVLVVVAALVTAYFLGPAGWRAQAAGTFGGLSTKVGKFIESGRADPRTGNGFGGAAATPPPPRFTDADRAYLDGVWKHVQSTFVNNPRVAVNLARSTAEGFFMAHGVSTEGLPEAPPSGADGSADVDSLDATAAGTGTTPEDTETLRLRLLAIKTWSDREAAR